MSGGTARPGGRIGHMISRKVVLPAALLVWCLTVGLAQTVTPSITIGIHVLKLGMPESTVLEQLGTDLILRKFPAGVKPSSAKYPPQSAWMIQTKTQSGFTVIGSVTFDDHRLTTAIRNWEIQESSSKSLFYAVNSALKELEADGLTACRVATYGASQMIDSPSEGGTGTLDTKEILIHCGMKQVKISLNLSDAPGMSPSSIQVSEWLQRE